MNNRTFVFTFQNPSTFPGCEPISHFCWVLSSCWLLLLGLTVSLGYLKSSLESGKFYFEDDIDSDGDGLTDEEDDDDDNDGVEDSGDS